MSTATKQRKILFRLTNADDVLEQLVWLMRGRVISRYIFRKLAKGGGVCGKTAEEIMGLVPEAQFKVILPGKE